MAAMHRPCIAKQKVVHSREHLLPDGPLRQRALLATEQVHFLTRNLIINLIGLQHQTVQWGLYPEQISQVLIVTWGVVLLLVVLIRQLYMQIIAVLFLLG